MVPATDGGRRGRVDSVNVPVPPAIEAVAADLRPALGAFDRIRDRHTLVLKRLDDTGEPHRIDKQVRRALAGAPAVEAAVSRIGWFADPPAGPAPVVYLAVESPGLVRLHRQLCERFGPVEGLEGPNYVPHVTLARGGEPAAAERLAERPIEPVRWTVSALVLWNDAYREPVGRIPLPG